MTSTYLNSVEALQRLGLYKPESGSKPNVRYLNYLTERNLLPRIVLGPRTFRYDLEDLENLLERVKNEGILLTSKP